MKTSARAALSLLLACAVLIGRAEAAADNHAGALATALKAEDELTRVIDKAAGAFVFVGGGSGVVVSADGFLLTNHHVAGDRRQVTVRIGSKMYVCDLVGTDPVGDLSLLKARDAADLPFVEFGDISKIRVGQQVLAVGDPFKLADIDGPPSFSMGTVSALHRFQGNYSDAIQTDSAVNPGNSGGPLLTLDGKLIGITGQIMSRFGAKANTGIGYAIPVDQILRFYPLLKDAEGRVVYHGTLPDGMTFVSRPDETQVAQVESVDAGSAAEKAGFMKGDRIVSVDSKPVYNFARLSGIIRSYPENSLLDLTVERGGKPLQMQLRLPRMQLPPGPAFVAPVGLKLETYRSGDGVRVAGVEKGSPAEKAGLAVGDIITTVEGKPATLEWSDLLATKKVGETLDVRVRRSGPNGISSRALSVVVEAARKQ